MPTSSEAQVIALTDVRTLTSAIVNAGAEIDWAIGEAFARSVAMSLLREGVVKVTRAPEPPPPLKGQTSIYDQMEPYHNSANPTLVGIVDAEAKHDYDPDSA